eukprot:TRINITY_DN12373_c0_g1_i1.p1 TRINITY_DN12373_c0_g1~~TRINITY_DN12373_c0_g1_i1.p1  ORF type:complete len:378 (+),score=57.97 TRINITY_DN12373_c0_g1_i1:33-1136(+)
MQVEAFHIEEASAARPGVQPVRRKLRWIRAGYLLGIGLIAFAALCDWSPKAEGQNFQEHPPANLQSSVDRISAESHRNRGNRTASGSDGSVQHAKGRRNGTEQQTGMQTSSGSGGGWSQVSGSELSPGGHIASIAAYALDAIKRQSNSLEVQNMTFGHILQASRQVVNGINSRIVIQLLPHGTATLDIFEQAWTNTLKVLAASYLPSDVALVQVDLITTERSLDASGFWGEPTNVSTGGWSQVSGSELVPGGHIASLAAYALDAIKGQSNSRQVQNVSFGHVLQASSQVVNGVNVRIVIQLLPEGKATLNIFEQSWTNTLIVLAASYSPSDISHMQAKLITKALTLDADAIQGNRTDHTTRSNFLVA